MLVKARIINWQTVPHNVEPFISPNQTCISSGKMYTVYAVSLYLGVVFVLVIDDLETPVFLPSWLFETVVTDIPHDWICHLQVSDDVEMILGPEFLARDLDAYNSLVDQESDQLARFWSWCQRQDDGKEDIENSS